MELGQVAEIIIGILVSRETKINGEYSYSLFNIKNHETNQVEEKIIHTSHFFSKQMTKYNDLVFRLVCPNKIVFINNQSDINKLVTSHFCIIRVNTKIVNPIFLKWYLEFGKGQEQIQFNITGSTVKKIAVSELRKIKIPQIDISIQNKLKDLIELGEREKYVLKEIIQKKNNLYNAIIEETIDKEKIDI